MRFRTRFFFLPTACLSLTIIGSGCDNSSINETRSPAAKGGAEAVKPAEPPPKSVAEYYERTQKQSPAPGTKGAAVKKGGETPK